MLFDSHTHINNETYTEAERQQLIAAIEASDVTCVMDIGFDLPSSLQAVKDAQENPWCYAAVGVHPHDAKTMDEEMLQMIGALTKKEKVQAIGEIGLDFHYNLSDADTQRYWFRRQIQLANELHMPIVIHSRDADQETMDILKEEGAFSDQRCSWFPKRKGPDGTEEKDARVLLHCFSGSLELGRQYVKLGATLSIAGPVTYKNNRKTSEVAREVPIEYLLVETDAPYLAPVPHRGERNESAYIPLILDACAKVLDIPPDRLEEVTDRNAALIFN